MKHDTTMEEDREIIEKFWEDFDWVTLIETKRIAPTHLDIERRLLKALALAHTSAQSTCDERIKQAVRDREEEIKKKIKIEEFIDRNDDGMWAGREAADTIISLLAPETLPTNTK